MPHVMVKLMGPVCPRLAPTAISWHGKAKYFSLIESNYKDSKSKLILH